MPHFQVPEEATPITDCSGLIPSWVHHLDDLNRVEAENILLAQRKYLHGTKHPKLWFHMGELKHIHQAMFHDVWTWAGQYRTSITSIGVHPSSIPRLLGEFCLHVQEWFVYSSALTPIEMAARVHHQLVFIHPFENGNGRFSRLVADRFLLALKCRHPIWPSKLGQNSEERKAYIRALKQSDKGDYTSLIDFMQRYGAQC